MDHQGGGEIDLSLREKLKNWQGNQGQKNFELKHEPTQTLTFRLQTIQLPSMLAGRVAGSAIQAEL